MSRLATSPLATVTVCETTLALCRWVENITVANRRLHKLALVASHLADAQLQNAGRTDSMEYRESGGQKVDVPKRKVPLAN